jgi:hypothetical protein
MKIKRTDTAYIVYGNALGLPWVAEADSYRDAFKQGYIQQAKTLAKAKSKK